MAKIEINFINGAYTARSKNLNAQLCQNFYIETDTTGAKNGVALIGCPGCIEWKDTGNYAEVRNFKVYQNNLYVVVGNTLYKISTAKTQTTIGTIGTSSGWVDMEEDGIYLVIGDSAGGWVYDGGTLTYVSPTTLTPSSLTYQDGYCIATITGTDQFFISAQDDFSTWDATDYATAESSGDILVSAKSVRNQLWLLGKFSTEVWYNSGETFPFNRNPGGVLPYGCSSKRSVAFFKDMLFWLDNQNRVVIGKGLTIQPVSTYQIDYQIGLMKRKDNSVGFTYSQEGHDFYEITFPTDSKTFCYDITTGIWHTRASGALNKRSIANCAIEFDSKVLVGDFENGKIYEYSLEAYDDDGEPKVAIRRGQTINDKKQRIFFGLFELDMETGIGNADVTDPQIMLRWSDDNGKTWSSEKWKSLGKTGEYKTRVRWKRLGSSFGRIFEVAISDAVKRNITNVYVDGTAGGTANAKT